MMKIKLIYGLCLLFAIMSCNRGLDKADYVQRIHSKDCGLLQSREVAGVSFEVLAEPTDYLLLKELNNGQLKFSELDVRRNQIEKMHYMILKLKPSHSSEDLLRWRLKSEDEYAQRLSYYSFDFQNHIKLKTEGGKVKCTLYHFERMYNLSGERTFLLGFPKSRESKELTIEIDSPVLNTGKVNININLENIPELNKEVLYEKHS